MPVLAACRRQTRSHGVEASRSASRRDVQLTVADAHHTQVERRRAVDLGVARPLPNAARRTPPFDPTTQKRLPSSVTAPLGLPPLNAVGDRRRRVDGTLPVDTRHDPAHRRGSRSLPRRLSRDRRRIRPASGSGRQTTAPGRLPMSPSRSSSLDGCRRSPLWAARPTARASPTGCTRRGTPRSRQSSAPRPRRPLSPRRCRLRRIRPPTPGSRPSARTQSIRRRERQKAADGVERTCTHGHLPSKVEARPSARRYLGRNSSGRPCGEREVISAGRRHGCAAGVVIDTPATTVADGRDQPDLLRAGLNASRDRHRDRSARAERGRAGRTDVTTRRGNRAEPVIDRGAHPRSHGVGTERHARDGHTRDALGTDRTRGQDVVAVGQSIGFMWNYTVDVIFIV